MINNVFRIVFSDGGHPEGRGRAKPIFGKNYFKKNLNLGIFSIPIFRKC